MLADLEKTATILQSHLGSAIGLRLLGKAEIFQFFSYLFNLEEWAEQDQLRSDAGDLYRQGEATGKTLAPWQTSALSDQLRSVVNAKGGLMPDGAGGFSGNVAGSYPAINDAIKMVDAYAGQPMSPTEMQSVRTSLENAAQQEGKVTKTYPAVALLSLARATALMWHTQIPELAALFPSDRLDRRGMVVRAIRQVLEQ